MQVRPLERSTEASAGQRICDHRRFHTGVRKSASSSAIDQWNGYDFVIAKSDEALAQAVFRASA